MLDTPDLYAEVGRLIRERREELGLTQERVASAIGLTRTSVTNIEKGRQKTLLHTFCAIAEVLKASPADLLPPSTFGLDEILEQAPDDAREWVMATVDAPNSEEDTI